MRNAAALSLAVMALGTAVMSAQESDRIEIVLPRDAIPAIDRPEFEPAAKADRVMADEELVIGLVGEREQRAYSTWQLDRHEIVNDVFEGHPVAVTWCPLCGTGVVYARKVAGRTLTFGVSGMLHKDGLVMYDRQTDTLWTHVDGRAVRGPLAGQQLPIVPAIHATWKEWQALYPNSQVLRKRGEFRSAYEDYNRSPGQLGIMGRRNIDTRLPGKERILGIRVGNAAAAFPLSAVRKARLVETEVGGFPYSSLRLRKTRPFSHTNGKRVLVCSRSGSTSQMAILCCAMRRRTACGTLPPGERRQARWLARS